MTDTDAHAGLGKVVYSARRWRLLGNIVGLLTTAGFFAIMSSSSASPEATGRAALIGTPFWVVLTLVLAAAILFWTLPLLRQMLDPKLMVIDDEGIEVRIGFFPKREKWRDYRDVETDRLRAYLVFETSGRRSKLMLPQPGLLGVTHDTLIKEFRPRIQRARALVHPV